MMPGDQSHLPPSNSGSVSDSCYRRLPWNQLGPIAACLALFAFSIFMFFPVIGSDEILFTTDDGIGNVAFKKRVLPAAFRSTWREDLLFGVPVEFSINLTQILLWALPVEVHKDTVYAIHASLASIFLMLFLRRRKLGWAASSMGALTAFWLGSNFTLVYAGHTGKFGVLMFAALFLWLYERTLAERSIPAAVLAGGAFGAMFLEQADVALLFGIFLGPYALARASLTYGLTIRLWIKTLVPLFGVALFLAAHPIWTGYINFVENVAIMKERDPKPKWEYNTQWSWPPAETMDFIAPGYMGWRSGEPSGPYWGRMGRSPKWESNGEGFQNFKLESPYLGAIPVGLAFWAALVALLVGRGKALNRAEMLLWSLFTLLAFLFACGKYLPFYRLLYVLPGVSSVRNPNKLLQVFQVGMGVLAAYGLDALLENGRAVWHEAISAKSRRGILIGFFIGCGSLAIMWIGSALSSSEIVAKMKSDGFGIAAEVISRLKIHSLMHAFVLCGILTLALVLFSRNGIFAARRVRLTAAWILVVIVAVDAKILSKHYVTTLDVESIRNNELAKFLARRQEDRRVYSFVTSGFYNHFIDYAFPYHNVRKFNFTAAPRLQSDYKQFIETLARNPVRLWQLGAVRYVLGPSHIWTQIQEHPELKDLCALVFEYNVVPTSGNGVLVHPATDQVPGAHCVVQFLGVAPRYALVDTWEIVDDEEALGRLAHPAFKPISTVIVSAGSAGDLKTRAGRVGRVGNVRTLSTKPGHVKLQVSTEVEAILRIADKIESGWRAWLNDEEVGLLRCDAIFMGIKVPAGLHQVTLRFERKRGTFWVQLFSLALCGGALVWPLLLTLTARRQVPTSVESMAP
jgi:hypothetical protein